MLWVCFVFRIKFFTCEVFVLWEGPLYFNIWVIGKVWMHNALCYGVVFWVVNGVIWYFNKFYP